MEAGKLDRRITIQRFTATTDALGGEVKTWIDIATVWASVEWVKDGERRERLQLSEVAASAEVRFQIRWGLGVTVEDRVFYDGRAWEITAVKEIGRRVGQELTARARAESD